MSAVRDAFFQKGKEALFTIEVEGVFRNEAEVDIALGQRGVGGDESAFTAHDLYKSYAVECVLGLDMGASDNRDGH